MAHQVPFVLHGHPGALLAGIVDITDDCPHFQATGERIFLLYAFVQDVWDILVQITSYPNPGYFPFWVNRLRGPAPEPPAIDQLERWAIVCGLERTALAELMIREIPIHLKALGPDSQ